MTIQKHHFSGYREWEIDVFPTGRRWLKWTAEAWRVGGYASDYSGSDPFAARTAEGALKKAMRMVKRDDESHRHDDEIAVARGQRPMPW